MELTYTEQFGRTPGSHIKVPEILDPLAQITYNFLCIPHFRCKRTEADLLSELIADVEGVDDDYFTRAEKLLIQTRLSFGTEVDYIRRKDGYFVRGGTRIPLLIKQDERRYVLKSYDEYDTERERKILQVVEGKIAPKVLVFGDTEYIEEYVDHEEFPSLESLMHTSNWGEVIAHAGRIHGLLAILGIDYNHNHTLDEFRISNQGEYRVIDFGTSRFFYDVEFFDPEAFAEAEERAKKALKEFNQAYRESRSEGFSKVKDRYTIATGEWMRRHDAIIRLQRVQEEKQKDFFRTERGDLLARVEDLDPITLTNLIKAVDFGEAAIKNFFERRIRTQFASGWDSLRPYQGKFREAFLGTYLGEGE